MSVLSQSLKPLNPVKPLCFVLDPSPRHHYGKWTADGIACPSLKQSGKRLLENLQQETEIGGTEGGKGE
ncbi:hypothetical protein SRHO_G00338790 [Serrasalmus rhombeus]